MAARISEIFLYKESGKWIFFIKNPNLTKTILAVGGGGGGRGGDVARVSDFFFSFFQKNPSQKKNWFLFERVKVRGLV